MVCHSGAYVGGRVFQKLGVFKSWPHQNDLGRFALTKKDSDRLLFKAPSLRNVEKTAPYLHDGSIPTLEQAVRIMAEYQVERPVTESEMKKIVAWLKSLTGDLPTAYIAPPPRMP